MSKCGKMTSILLIWEEHEPIMVCSKHSRSLLSFAESLGICCTVHVASGEGAKAPCDVEINEKKQEDQDE